MKKRKLSLFMSTLSGIALIFSLTISCREDLRPAVYTVTFDSRSATTDASPASKTVTSPATTVDALPTDPEKTDYTFTGWWTEENGAGTEFTASTAVTGDITVYALWESDTIASLEKRDMMPVAGGTFTQRDTNSQSFSHTLSAFKMAKYEVTYELWYTVKTWADLNGYTFVNPGQEGDDGTPAASPNAGNYEPVTLINWRDSIVWCNAYSEIAGLDPVYRNSSNEVLKNSSDTAACDAAIPDWSASGYRLPTEGEWQYAASYIDDSTSIPFNHASGDTSNYCYPIDGGESTIFGDYAWYDGNSEIVSGDGRHTQDVGGRLANALGIHDMSGNICEWCWDKIGNYPTGPQVDYRGVASSSYRATRGGQAILSSILIQVGYRITTRPPNWTNTGYGFRVSRSN